MGEASWHQRWQKERKRGTVFPFTVLCTCQNGVFRVFFSLFLLLFDLLLLHTPARLLCNTTETPSGIERRCNVSESVCLCGPGQIPPSPKLIFSVSFIFVLSHTHTHAHTSLIFQLWTTFLLFFFFWAVRQNAKLPPPSLHTHAHTHLKFRAFSASPSQIFPVNALAIIWVH